MKDINLNFNSREQGLIRLIKQAKISQSHNFDHLNRVARFSLQLAKLYEADRDVLIAAAYCHDLARSNKKYRGAETARQAAVLARPLLKKVGYSKEEIAKVTRVISEHDQPDFHSDLLESKILKDADYLDGFGARGILRCIVYAMETGGGVDEALVRIRVKMRQRLEGLEFIESRRLGWKMYRLAELFLEELEPLVRLTDYHYPGKLIVLEGISGSGKDTQVKLLAEYLRKKGRQVKVVNHPAEFLKSLWKKWRRNAGDIASESFLILADRVRMTSGEILPALKRGEIVVSSRSSVSLQVYQANARYSEAFYRLAFKVEPLADLVVYLDISPKDALARVDARVKKGQEKSRGFFGVKQEKQIKKYKEILEVYPNVVKVDALGSIDRVHKRIVACVENNFSLR